MTVRDSHPKRINLLDTAVSTANLGDLIIVGSMLKELSFVLDKLHVTNVPTHDYIGKVGRKLIQESPLSLMLGTNILQSKHKMNRGWRLRRGDAASLANKVLLCGVGWSNYEKRVRYRQKRFYRKALNSELLHSVRDSRVQEMLHAIGITNVVNTSCLTTWSLNEEHCKEIPTKKSSKAVFTVTGHKPSDSDRLMLSTLDTIYDELHFWPQQLGDMEYFLSVADEAMLKKANIIPPSLNAYDAFLAENDTDYVGTRLHGGIRALQHDKVGHHRHR